MTAKEIKSIEERFFTYFPKSKAERPFNYHRAYAALRHILTHEKINGAKKAFTDEQLKDFEDMTSKRKVKGFSELPKELQEAISIFVTTFEIYYDKKLTELYLTGSFVQGHWRTEETIQDPKNKQLLSLIEAIKGKTGLSDVDVFPVPCLGTFQVGCVQVHTQPWEKVLIYKNGKFIS